MLGWDWPLATASKGDHVGTTLGMSEFRRSVNGTISGFASKRSLGNSEVGILYHIPGRALGSLCIDLHICVYINICISIYVHVTCMHNSIAYVSSYVHTYKYINIYLHFYMQCICGFSLPQADLPPCAPHCLTAQVSWRPLCALTRFQGRAV